MQKQTVTVLVAVAAVISIGVGGALYLRSSPAVDAALTKPMPTPPTSDDSADDDRRRLQALEAKLRCDAFTPTGLVTQNPRVLAAGGKVFRVGERREIDPKLAKGAGVWYLSLVYACGRTLITVDSQLDHAVVDAVEAGPESTTWSTLSQVQCYPASKASDAIADGGDEAVPPLDDDIVAAGEGTLTTTSPTTKLSDGIRPSRVWRADTVARRLVPLRADDYRCLRIGFPTEEIEGD